MGVGDVIVRLLELAAFLAFNFGFAAAIRGWYKWPRLRERTAAAAAAVLLTAPLLAVAFRSDDATNLFAAVGLFAVNYAAILAGLRVSAPSGR